MGMLRCPTCLTLLDGGEAKCPACRTRLRKRSQPIVLGEKTRIAAQPKLQFDRVLRETAEAKNAEAKRRRRVAEATHRSPAETRPVTPRPVEPAEVVAELVWTPEPEVMPEPAPLIAAFDPEPEIEIALEEVEADTAVSAVLLDEPERRPEREPVAPASIFKRFDHDPVVPAQRFERRSPTPETEAEAASAARSLLFTSVTPTPARDRAVDIAPEPAAPAKPRFGLFDLTWDDEHEPAREEYRPGPSRSRRFIDLSADAEAEAAHVIDLEAGADKPTGEDMHEMFEALHRKARADETEHEHDRALPDLDAYAKAPTSRALRLTGTRANRRRRWSAESRDSGFDSDNS